MSVKKSRLNFFFLVKTLIKHIHKYSIVKQCVACIINALYVLHVCICYLCDTCMSSYLLYPKHLDTVPATEPFVDASAAAGVGLVSGDLVPSFPQGEGGLCPALV